MMIEKHIMIFIKPKFDMNGNVIECDIKKIIIEWINFRQPKKVTMPCSFA